MMNLMRNPEVFKTVLIYTLISAFAIILSFILDIRFGILMCCVCILFFVIYIIGTYTRYRRISQLAFQIDKILHGEESISIGNYSEGELGVLQSEIYKMTVRLREQRQNLQNDKVYLADSLADIAHQLRTPLTSINLLLSFISDPNITDERRQNISREMYGVLSRIDWLITALLKISKLDAGTVKFNTQTIPLKELIDKSVLPLLVSMDIKNQTLKISADGDFNGDTAWTQEAITNIVKNCTEHTDEGGTVQITASENPLYSEIIISDNGSGIDKEDLAHIFERFYKGKNSDSKSFGIGLNLARMIITAQNGTVKAENNASRGAKFTVRFYKGVV